MSLTSGLQPLAILRAFVCPLLVVGLAVLLPVSALAGTFTLSDDNSVVEFDTDSSTNAFDWEVDGVDHLFQQGFWYRVGSVAEQPLETLPHPVEGTTDTNFDGEQDTLFVRYDGAGFQIETRYALNGGADGSGASDLAEQISITNLGITPLDFHFFQYADFDLIGTPLDDRAVFTNANAVRQFEDALRLTETIVTPVPSHREIDFFDITRSKLDDALPTTLSDTPATGVVFGPGDVTWAYQWDVSILPGTSFQIGKQKNLNAGIIPEPATCAMLSAALTLLVLSRRRD